MDNPLKRIMLVEDDPDIQLITRLSLEIGGGFDVLVCGSGFEAVQSAPVYAPELILLDMMMPGMDGLATMDALRKLPRMSATPIVFFTANTDDETRQDLLRRGALDVVLKPIEPTALVEQIRAIWRRRESACSP
jgi:DNA-binding response OmpR family regulator